MRKLQTGLIFCVLALAGDESPSPQPDAAGPRLETVLLVMNEAPGTAEGSHDYWVSLPESLRERHFLFQVDRSACQGDLMLNGSKVVGEDASDLLSFGKSNHVHISHCLERTAHPLRLSAVPKVYLAAISARRQTLKQNLDLHVTIRNTLANSVTVTLSVAGEDFDFFLGPETSQTRTLVLRLTDSGGSVLPVEMWKFPETFEGAYRHYVEVPITQL